MFVKTLIKVILVAGFLQFVQLFFLIIFLHIVMEPNMYSAVSLTINYHVSRQEDILPLFSEFLLIALNHTHCIKSGLPSVTDMDPYGSTAMLVV